MGVISLCFVVMLAVFGPFSGGRVYSEAFSGIIFAFFGEAHFFLWLLSFAKRSQFVGKQQGFYIIFYVIEQHLTGNVILFFLRRAKNKN